jgi:hypothetical protein
MWYNLGHKMSSAALISADKKRLSALLSIGVFFSFILLCIGLLMMGHIVIRHLFFLEDICRQRAMKIVGDNWNKPVMASPADRDHQFVDSNNKIRWGMQEQLRCEDEDKPFGLF